MYGAKTWFTKTCKDMVYILMGKNSPILDQKRNLHLTSFLPGGLATMNDRKHRLVKMKRVFTRKAEETRLAMEACLHGLPVNSISLDNGAEFAEFRKLEENLSTLVYFAEPHKPWQRGTNENSNGLIRFFFPKGFDFRTVTDEYVQYVEDLLNNRPRKCLGWKTPYESFYESVALA